MSLGNDFARLQSEAQFQRAVIATAEANGWLCAHFHDSRRQVVRANGSKLWVGDKSAAGFPDIVCVRERVVYLELKSPKGRLSKAQGDWITALSEAGEEVYVLRPSDWDAVQQILGRRQGALAAPAVSEGEASMSQGRGPAGG